MNCSPCPEGRASPQVWTTYVFAHFQCFAQVIFFCFFKPYLSLCPSTNWSMVPEQPAIHWHNKLGDVLYAWCLERVFNRCWYKAVWNTFVHSTPFKKKLNMDIFICNNCTFFGLAIPFNLFDECGFVNRVHYFSALCDLYALFDGGIKWCRTRNLRR